MFTFKPITFPKLAAIIYIAILCGNAADSFAQQTKSEVFRTEVSLLAAERLLRSIRSLKSPFIQATTTGNFATGTLYIRRPGKLRIDYKKPETLQIYADGTWVFYIDEELKEISQVPLAATPASFLIRDNFTFSEDLTILKITKTLLSLEIKVARRGKEEAGSLTLIFSGKVDAFRGWAVTDARGIKTTIKLMSPVINKPISKHLFDFTPPDWAFPKDEQ